jgi:hypothetical protein
MCKICVCENCRMYYIRNDMQKLSQIKLDFKSFWKVVIYKPAPQLYMRRHSLIHEEYEF